MQCFVSWWFWSWYSLVFFKDCWFCMRWCVWFSVWSERQAHHTQHTHTQHTHTFLWISIHPSIQPNTPFSTVTGIWYFHVVLLWTLVDYRRNKNQYDTMNAISIQATFYIHNIMYLTWASMAEEIVKQTLPSMYIYIYIIICMPCWDHWRLLQSHSRILALHSDMQCFVSWRFWSSVLVSFVYGCQFCMCCSV